MSLCGDDQSNWRSKRARASWREGVESRAQYKPLRNQLMAQDKLVVAPDGKALVFTEDVPFRSTSAAAAVIMGRNANGQTEWRLGKSGLTYKAWQQAKLSSVAPGSDTVLDPKT